MHAPEWFLKNVAEVPSRDFVTVEGCPIETLAWGNVGDRGLLFVHGNGAHADWWAPFAPFFSKEWRVGAFSSSGSGRSGWREHYTMEQLGRETIAVAEHLDIFSGPEKPWLVAHSLGSHFATCAMTSEAGRRFAGLIIVDCGAPSPTCPAVVSPQKVLESPGYGTLEEGMARFRLRPHQPPIEDWMHDHIARNSLCEREGRWHWCFDPKFGPSLGTGSGHVPGFEKYIPAAQTPLVFLWGDQSALMTPATVAYNRDIAPAGTRFIEVPGAHHHMMLDHPLEFVSALRSVLEPESARVSGPSSDSARSFS